MGTRRALTQDLGHSGLNTNGWGTGDDWLDEWRTTSQKVKSVDEMLKNCAVVGALRLAIEMPIRDIEWYLVSEDGEDDPRLDLVRDAMDNLSHSMNDHIIDALLTPFYGWSAFTIIYERVGGRLLWRKFKPLGHDTIMRWMIADDGGIEGLQQYPYLYPDPIPIERMILYRFRKTRNNPEGESVLRPAWQAWYFVKNLQQIEAIAIERNLNGLPVITPPMGADMSETASSDWGVANKLVRNVRNDEQGGVVLPPASGPEEHQRWKLELLTGGGGGKAIDTNLVIARYEKRILMASLAQFLIIGMDNVGALATFEGATGFFDMSVNALADIIAETFSKYAIPRLLRLNGMDENGISYQHGRAGNMDLQKLAAVLQQTGRLVTWGPEDEVWLRGIMRLPEISVEQLEEKQAEKEARNAEIAARLQQARDSEGDDNDDMSAEYYAAGNAPDDDERRRYEGSWERKMRGFWSRELPRVMAGAKKIQRA